MFTLADFQKRVKMLDTFAPPIDGEKITIDGTAYPTIVIDGASNKFECWFRHNGITYHISAEPGHTICILGAKRWRKVKKYSTEHAAHEAATFLQQFENWSGGKSTYIWFK